MGGVHGKQAAAVVYAKHKIREILSYYGTVGVEVIAGRQEVGFKRRVDQMKGSVCDFRFQAFRNTRREQKRIDGVVKLPCA